MNSCCYQSVRDCAPFVSDVDLMFGYRFIPPAKRAVRVGVVVMTFDM